MNLPAQEIKTDVLHDIGNVSVDDLLEIDTMKLLLNVSMGGERLSVWAERNSTHIQKLLQENGALLIRGLKFNSSKQFGTVLERLFDAPLISYTYRSTPRTGLRGNVYTATEYSADEIIPQHNENAYSRSWPNRIGFLCMLPSETGGATPISDTRYILKNLPNDVRKRFEDKGIMYVRNYSKMDLPWTEVFQTENREEVEAYCKLNAIHYEWKGDDGLRTIQINPAIVKHPLSGEELWFNQVHLFHVSNLEPELRKTMQDTFDECQLPRNTYYGDGSVIEEQDLDIIRRLYLESSIRFDWQKDDLLLLDNMLFTHGREAFTGERIVLTGMAKPNK